MPAPYWTPKGDRLAAILDDETETLPQCCYGTNTFYCIQCEQRDMQEASNKEK